MKIIHCRAGSFYTGTTLLSRCWGRVALGSYSFHKNNYQAIVVGAGIGGLAVASLLAVRGMRVLMLEAHRTVGGNCVSWSRAVNVGGRKLCFTFDSGVQDISGLGSHGPLRNLLRGLSAEDLLTWHRVRHCYYRDGLWLEGALDADDFIKNYCRQFPEEAPALRAFFAEMQAIYREMYADVEDTGGVPVPPSVNKLTEWAERHPHASQWLMQPFDAMLDAYFASEPLKAMLRTVSEYITENPHCLRVRDMAPLFGYYFEGGAYPSGGAQKLANLLASRFEAFGGRLCTGTPVAKILTSDGHASGVETCDGEVFRAPLVISNADVVRTLTKLMNPELLPGRYLAHVRALKRGPSAFLLSLGLNTIPNFPARFFVHQNGLTFGIGNPSVIDPTLAPAGCSAMTFLCLLSEAQSAEWLVRGADYMSKKRAFADRLIHAAEAVVCPDLSRHIVFREAATPASFVRYTGAMGGNIYGAARGGWRPGMRTPVPGLMLVGGGVEAGAGIEGVVVSATRAADVICPQHARGPETALLTVVG